MRRIPVHIDHSFTEGFFDSIPKATFQELLFKSSGDIKLYNMMFDILFNKSDLEFEDLRDKDDLVRLAKDNPFFHQFIESHNAGRIALRFTGNRDRTEQYDKYPASLIKYNSSRRQSWNSFLISDLVHWKNDMSHLIEPIHYQLNRDPMLNSFPGWGTIKRMKIPCNAAIIHDRYLFSDTSAMDKNLFAMLDAIIPEETGEVPFHLTILASEKEVTNPKRTCEDLNRVLGVKYGARIQWGLSLVKYQPPHDREILTNYYRLSSQDSFNYYSTNGKVTTNTKLDFIPIVCGDLNNYFSKLRELFEANGRSNRYGHKYNRLFDLLK